MIPHPGDVLLVDHNASVQFAGESRLVLRVISVRQEPTYQGWVWLAGYVLDDSETAVDRREIFVQMDGLRRLPSGPLARVTSHSIALLR